MSSTIRAFFALGLFVYGMRAQTMTVEDNHQDLLYSSTPSWEARTNPEFVGGRQDPTYWHGGTAISTRISGASVTFRFNGSHIAYYGDKNSDHGQVKITLDGTDTFVDAFNSQGPLKQVRLFEADVDPSVPGHTITVTCMGFPTAIDYFLYTRADLAASTTAPLSNGPSANESSGTPQGSQKQAAPSAPLAAVVASAVLAVLGWVLALVLFFLLARTGHQLQLYQRMHSLQKTTAKPWPDPLPPSAAVAYPAEWHTALDLGQGPSVPVIREAASDPVVVKQRLMDATFAMDAAGKAALSSGAGSSSPPAYSGRHR